MEQTTQNRPPSLRDRKRERTRAAIVDAATELFERRGYEETTIADIAAAADIGTRTFFGYFESKDELLFPDHDRRADVAIAAIAARGPHDRPVEVLLSSLEAGGAASEELVGRTSTLRMQLMETVPAVRGRAYRILQDAQRRIAQALEEAYPGELDAAQAMALVGAFIGAVDGARAVLVDDPSQGSADPATLLARIRETVARVLDPA